MKIKIRHHLIVAATLVLACAAHGAERFASVDYMGSRISLSRAYVDFDEYKSDPTNLPQQSIRRAESIMRSVPFGPNFVNAAALSQELDRIQFPGYGSFYANQLGARLDPSLELVYVEIPGRKLNRYFAVERAENGTLRVVADFVASALPEIVRVHRKNGALSFESRQGAPSSKERKFALTSQSIAWP